MVAEYCLFIFVEFTKINGMQAQQKRNSCSPEKKHFM